MENIENYYCYKFIQFVCFNEYKPNDYEEMIEHICNSEFLKIFKSFVDEFIVTDYLPIKYKEPLYDLINLIREKTELNKDNLDNINYIISALNVHDGCHEDQFYCAEILKRFPELCNGKISKTEYEEHKIYVDFSAKCDLDILYTHINMTEQQFIDECEDKYTGSSLYYLSINCLLYEKPDLIDLNCFRNNILLVLQNNIKSLKTKKCLF